MWIFGEVPFGTVVNFRSHPPVTSPTQEDTKPNGPEPSTESTRSGGFLAETVHRGQGGQPNLKHGNWLLLLPASQPFPRPGPCMHVGHCGLRYTRYCSYEKLRYLPRA